MATYRLKRKTYSDENGMSTRKKAAIGALGTIGTGAALFAGAKTGKLGAGLQKSANAAWGNVGARLSKAGLTGTGGKMMTSGSKGISEAQTSIAKKKLAGKSNYAINSAGGVDAVATKSGQNVSRMYENRWNNIINPS